jgi:hypothetical protein
MSGDAPKLATRRTLLEVTVYHPTRPTPQHLLALGINGPCEIRDDEADGHRRWIITDPPPTRWQSSVEGRIRLTATVAAEVTAMLTRLLPSTPEADHLELAHTLADVIANKLVGGS